MFPCCHTVIVTVIWFSMLDIGDVGHWSLQNRISVFDMNSTLLWISKCKPMLKSKSRNVVLISVFLLQSRSNFGNFRLETK